MNNNKQICIGGRTYYTIETAKQIFKLNIELKDTDIYIDNKIVRVPLFVKDNNVLISLDEFVS